MSKAAEQHPGEVIDRANGFSVIDCQRCGFRHVWPLPGADELERVYRHEYYATDKPLYLERYRQDLHWWNLVYAERFAGFEAQLPAERRRLLDVGSGPGFFLLHGQQRGWQVQGVEPSQQAVEHSRALGVPVEEAFLTAATAAALGRFDVVHMSSVLEHIPQPAEFLQLVKACLKPGGLLSISVPNDYNPFQSALRDACDFSPWWLVPPHHLNFFSFASLRRLLERLDYEYVEQQASFPIDMFLLMGENYVGDDAKGRQCHQRRMTFEQNLHRAGKADLLRELYRNLAECDLGREINMLVRLNDA